MIHQREQERVMARRNAKLEAIHDAGFETERIGNKLYVQGDQAGVHGFAKTFPSIAAAHDQLLGKGARATIEELDGTWLVKDPSYKEKGTKDGIVAHVGTQAEAIEFCEVYGYKLRKKKASFADTLAAKL